MIIDGKKPSLGTFDTERSNGMRVTLEKNYRKYYTLEDLDRARKVIAAEKEHDDCPDSLASLIRIQGRRKNETMDDLIYNEFLGRM